MRILDEVLRIPNSLRAFFMVLAVGVGVVLLAGGASKSLPVPADEGAMPDLGGASAGSTPFPWIASRSAERLCWSISGPTPASTLCDPFPT